MLSWSCNVASSPNNLVRWYATETPVIPDPIMQTSAPAVRGPVLPARARGFTPGAAAVQNERVALGTGSDADSEGGEEMAWKWACNRSYKDIGEKVAETCTIRNARPRASNW